jgi:YVTN family beta-propeller protein
MSIINMSSPYPQQWSVAATLSTLTQPTWPIWNYSNNTLYVTGKNANQVQIWNASSATPSSWSVTATVSTGASPQSGVIAPNGSVYIPCYSSPAVLTYINTSNVASNITLTSGVNANQSDISPDGTIVAVTCNNGYVFKFSTVTNTVITSVKIGNQANSCQFSPDGLYVFAANYADGQIAKINVASWTYSAISAGGTSCVGACVCGNYVYTGNNGSGTVSMVNVATNQLVALIPAGTTPATQVPLLTTSQYVYATNYGSQNTTFIKVQPGST